MVFAAPAQAKGSRDAGSAAAVNELRANHKYRHGVLPTRQASAKAALANRTAAGPLVFYGLEYFGGTDDPPVGKVGVVTGNPKVYIIYVGSQWGTATTDGNQDLTFSGDPAGMAPRQQEFFKGIGTNNENWSNGTSEWCQGVATGATSCPGGAPHIPYPVSGSVLAGVWYDGAAPVDMNATAHSIAQEAVNAAAHFGNTTTASNKDAQYIITYPTGARPDGWTAGTSGFCAWHDFNGDPNLTGGGAVPSPAGNIAFTNMPYLPDAGINCGAGFVNSTGGDLDGVSIVGGHEYQETLTDPFPYAASPTAVVPEQGGWLAKIYDLSTGEVVESLENADLCAWRPPGKPGGGANVALSTGTFPIQGSWSNAANSCVSALSPMTAKPAVLFNPNNHNIEVYEIAGGNLVEKYWNASNGQWSGWGDFGAFDTDPMTYDNATVPLTGNPAVFYNPGNHNIEVYANAGGHLVEKYWQANNGAWSGWSDFGGSLSGSPKVFYNQNNRNVEVYANSGGHLVEKYWQASNGAWSGWGDFGAPATGNLTGDPAVLYNPNNSNVEIYGNSGGHLVEKYWQASNGAWSGWGDFGVPATGNLTGSPAAFYNPNNHNMELYGNSAGHLVEKYWNASNGAWSGWGDFGAPATGNLAGDPTVVYNNNNRNVEIYGNSGGHLVEKYWQASNGAWSGWGDFGGNLTGDPTVLYNPNNRNMEIYALTSGHLEEKYWNASNGQWSGWGLLS